MCDNGFFNGEVAIESWRECFVVSVFINGIRSHAAFQISHDKFADYVEAECYDSGKYKDPAQAMLDIADNIEAMAMLIDSQLAANKRHIAALESMEDLEEENEADY